jgi:phospholipid transport system substrate-binding protein
MGSRWTRLVAATILATLLGVAPAARGGEPTEQLRADIDELYRVVNQSPATPAGQGGTPGRAIVDRMFDWTAMAEASLRHHWQKRTPEERAEFTRIFSDLFARAYLSRINLVDAGKFKYLGEAINGDRATIKTKVFTKRGSDLDVDYLVRATPAQRWLVRDVRVEAISLVDNYRAQFDSIIAQSSYEELVKQLKALVK